MDTKGKPNMVMNDYFVPNNHENMVQMSLKCKQLDLENKKLKDMLKAEVEMSEQLRKEKKKNKKDKVKATQLYIWTCFEIKTMRWLKQEWIWLWQTSEAWKLCIHIWKFKLSLC